MGTVLAQLVQADPTLRWRQEPATKQVILSGMGDIHIAVAIARAERMGVGLTTSVPKVPYRETITKVSTASYRHKKQTGGAGQFGEVHLRIEPLPDKEFEYVNEVVGGAIARPSSHLLRKAYALSWSRACWRGCPIVNVKVAVIDGKMHPVDSRDIAFQIAGARGIQRGLFAGSAYAPRADHAGARGSA